MLNIHDIRANMYDDIRKAKSKQLKDIDNMICILLDEYDDDNIRKDIKDFLKRALTLSYRDRIKLKFDDLVEEWDRLTPSRKEVFEMRLVELINIHQSLVEIFGNLMKGL